MGFWCKWSLAERMVPPGDSGGNSSLLEHVRLAVWNVPPDDDCRNWWFIGA
ncbi:hypothetical protein DEO72_LG9g2117 [Vigna unguiculata]|uniref:Uncharacterized protein n=1 Tax=Vigna unguiculata TaxID=3917 RepID=A0A4D6N2L9_VIGUN|nr:hypothetical protein DEO72_LG9g2117 [Vigna unguiculata]